MTETVHTDLVGGVLTITLDDPPKRNALSRQLAGELIAAMNAAETDDAVRVVVVTNTGTTFCAGADLSERSTAGAVIDPADIFGFIRRSTKPYVGRIAGHAIAGGLGLAASMDISVAVEQATFGFSEVRLGLAPAVISVICLPKMRQADAAEAFLRGNRFGAERAAELGLINAATSAETLDAAVGAVVADLLEGGPLALAESKKLLRTIPSMNFDEALSSAGDLSARLFSSEEGTEGMRSFLEKRAPRWSPRADQN